MNKLAISLLTAATLLSPLASAQVITVTSPAGGESWEVGSKQHITWTTTLLDVSISYSTDDGATWHTPKVADSVDSNNAAWLDFEWTVPDTPSAQCKVRVDDYDQVQGFDVSATFSIVAKADNTDDDAGGCAAYAASTGTGTALALLGLALLRRRR